MSCPVCKETMQFVFKDGEGEFICPSCEHVKAVEHIETTI